MLVGRKTLMIKEDVNEDEYDSEDLGDTEDHIQSALTKQQSIVTEKTDEDDL